MKFNILATVTLALLLLSLPAPAQELGASELPDPEEVEDYLTSLLAANRQTIQAGDLTVTVTVIPDYLDYIIAQEYLSLGVDPGDREFVARKLARLEKKHRNKRRVGVIISLANSNHRTDNFYAFVPRPQFGVVVGGQGKVPLKGVAQLGSLTPRKYTLFKAPPGHTYGANPPPVMYRRLAVVASEYTVHLILKHELKERARDVRVGIGGMVHVHGRGITGDQLDFERGAVIDAQKLRAVEFELPLLEPAMPAGLAAFLSPVR